MVMLRCDDGTDVWHPSLGFVQFVIFCIIDHGKSPFEPPFGRIFARFLTFSKHPCDLVDVFLLGGFFAHLSADFLKRKP